jgi:Uma2 family endonuclease
MSGAWLDYQKKTWTTAEVAKMELSGILDGERFELIEGELVERPQRLAPHVLVAILTGNWLRGVFGYLFVAEEATVRIDGREGERSAPQPDFIVLGRAFPEVGMPQAQDLVLAVEISATTLAFDLTTKAKLYARAGVVEYWVLDVVGKRVVIHRDSDGVSYREVSVHGATEMVGTLARPEARVLVGELFAVGVV